MAKKVRLDQLLVQRGLAETRSKAQALILAGAVRVANTVGSKAGDMVPLEVELFVEAALPYASRGGYKLAHALEEFKLSPQGLTVIDVGSSTGGFTDVMLQQGAARVYAVDVGYGLLDWRLRQDPRVVVLERTNIRYLERLPLEAPTEPAEASETQQPDEEPRANPITIDEDAPVVLADCACIDVAFISLRLVLPALRQLITPEAWVVALIKPQFEAGAEQVGKGGVVRDPAVHASVIRMILDFANENGFAVHGLARSPITGPAGNVEFLAWLGGQGPELQIDSAIKTVVGR